VPAADDEAFEAFLRALAYPYQRERGNAAYELFLQ
jgi:hypothetical protein